MHYKLFATFSAPSEYNRRTTVSPFRRCLAVVVVLRRLLEAERRRRVLFQDSHPYTDTVGRTRSAPH